MSKTIVNEIPTFVPISTGRSGMKFDNGKPKLHTVFSHFPNALREVSRVAEFGANKYADYYGWKRVRDAEERYSDALLRHLLPVNNEPYDSESHLLHIAHAAWNALAVLEIALNRLQEDSNQYQVNQMEKAMLNNEEVKRMLIEGDVENFSVVVINKKDDHDKQVVMLLNDQQVEGGVPLGGIFDVVSKRDEGESEDITKLFDLPVMSVGGLALLFASCLRSFMSEKNNTPILTEECTGLSELETFFVNSPDDIEKIEIPSNIEDIYVGAGVKVDKEGDLLQYFVCNKCHFTEKDAGMDWLGGEECPPALQDAIRNLGAAGVHSIAPVVMQGVVLSSDRCTIPVGKMTLGDFNNGVFNFGEANA